MKDVYGKLRDIPCDLRVVSTGGDTTRDGMPRCGRRLRPGAPGRRPLGAQKLGALIRLHGNRPVRFLAVNGAHVASLMVLPRPGCGNERLKWADVKGRIGPLLEDRFTVVTK